MPCIAVCDDCPRERENTVAMVRRWSEESGIPVRILSCENGDELLTKMRSASVDVLFLDILMPLLNGMDTARELRQTNTATHIVFLTASPEFALDSYEVKAKGYLIKPATYDKIKAVLEEYTCAVPDERKSVVFKTPFGYQKLFLHNIEYIEAQNRRVVLFLTDGHSVETAEPLHAVEEKLADDPSFFRCHRSYLVYLPNIDRFNTTEITTRSGHRLPVARASAKPLKEAYFSLMFEE